jgi:hypothetical protein
VAASQIRRFDAGALHSALDARRVSLVDELWEQSSELNSRRDDHPIAVATVTGMKRRRGISAQHALFMLRWLGQPPEAFLGYSGELPARWALPEAEAGSRRGGTSNASTPRSTRSAGPSNSRGLSSRPSCTAPPVS